MRSRWVLGAFTSLALAACPSSGGGPLLRYTAVHNTLEAMGFRQVGSLSMGSLGTDDRVRIPVDLDAGTCTTWVALGAKGVRDISIEVLDPDGRSLATDRTHDAQAAVQACAEVSGEHVVVLHVEAGAGEYILGAWRAGEAGQTDRPAVAASGTCASPIPIAPGDTRSGDTTRGSNEASPTCAESDAPETVYSLEVRRRTAVRVLLESNYDGMLYLQRECGRRETEIACNDDYPDANRSRIDAVLEPGRYSLVVDGYGNARGVFSVTVESTEAPDVASLCSDATPLTPGAAASGTTVGARDDFQATCAGGARSPDRLFKLDVPRRSRVRLTQQSQHDGAIYVRRECGDPVSEIACNDDHLDRAHSLLTLLLERGTYWVFSDGYGPNESGTFELRADVSSADGSGTAGDRCGDALPLSLGTTEGDTFTARDDLNGSCTSTGGAPDVVYRLDVPSSSRVQITAEQLGSGGAVVYLQRTCGDRASEVACAVGEVDAVLAAGRYYVVVDGNVPTSFGEYRLTTSVQDSAALETACRRAPLLRAGQTVNGFTSGDDRFRPSCAQNARSPETIYRLRLPRRSTVDLSLAAGYDAVLYVRRDCLDAATEVACNDDDVDQMHSRITQTLDAGTYFVFVDGFGSGNSGTFDLTTTLR